MPIGCSYASHSQAYPISVQSKRHVAIFNRFVPSTTISYNIDLRRAMLPDAYLTRFLDRQYDADGSS